LQFKLRNIYDKINAFYRNPDRFILQPVVGVVTNNFGGWAQGQTAG